jgi:hypothetical protein
MGMESLVGAAAGGGVRRVNIGRSAQAAIWPHPDRCRPESVLAETLSFLHLVFIRLVSLAVMSHEAFYGKLFEVFVTSSC